MCAYLFVCVSCEFAAHRGQKRPSELLRLELQAVVSYRAGAGTELRSSSNQQSGFPTEPTPQCSPSLLEFLKDVLYEEKCL